jgi:hypothetical protein
MMINYTEKGYGLHLRITQTGHVLHEENGVWLSSNDAAVQAIIDSYTLADAQNYKCAEVEAKAKALRDTAIKTVSAGEMASWPIKLAEARAFGADANASCPMLSAEAAARGVTLAQLVDRVNANATGFAWLESTISGMNGKHRDAIKALTTFAEVNCYDYSQDWPEV